MSDTSPLLFRDNLPASIQDGILESNVNSVSIQARELVQGNSTSFGAVFIVINAAMGAGLLAFPYAFFLAGGWQWGIVVQLLMIPFIIGGLMILSYCAELKQAGTYEEIMEHMFGPHFRSLTEILVFVYCFGACITYLVVMGDQIEDITNAFKYHDKNLSVYWWANRKLTITVATFLLIYPWLYLKNIGVLSYTSFFGVLCCIYIGLVVFANYFVTFKCNSPRKLPSPYSTSWETAFNAIPFICFAFQCHISAVPIYAGLKKRNFKNFFLVSTVGVLICTIVYTVTGVFGEMYFVHQDPISPDILRNYCPTNIAVSIARGTLILCLITSYPILFYCGRTALESALTRLLSLVSALYNTKRKKDYQKSFRVIPTLPCTPITIRRIVLSNVWLFLSLGLALFVPQVNYIISPMGCLAAVFIFVFPGLCLFKLSLAGHFLSQFRNTLLLFTSCVQITIGMFIMGNALVHNILKDFGQD